MIYPLKQYRQFLLITAILCTLTLLLFSAIKVNATHLPAVPLSQDVLAREHLASQSLTHPTLAANLINTLSLPAFPKNSMSGLATLTIHNYRSAVTTYQIQLYSRAGEELFDQLGTIPANGSVQFVPTDIAEIPDGDYQVTVFSDGPLNALVSIEDPVSQSLGLYNSVGPIASTPIFGPLFKGATSSTLILANTFATTVTTQINFMDLTGTTVATQTQTMPANGGVDVPLSTIEALPDGFVGTATVTSQDGNFAGVVQQVDALGKITYQNALSSTGLNTGASKLSAGQTNSSAFSLSRTVSLFLPRIYNAATPDDEVPIQTSSLFLTAINSNDTNLIATAYAYDSSAQTDFLGGIVLPSQASIVQNLSEIAALEAGQYSAVISSDGPLVATTVASFDGPTSYGADSYRPTSSGSLVSVTGTRVTSTHIESVATFPRVVKDGTNHSVVSIQNVGTSVGSLLLTFYDRFGNTMHTQTQIGPQPNLAVSVNLRMIPELPSDYVGSLEVASDQPFASQVDEYRDFAAPLTPDPVTLTVTGPERGLLNQPMQAIAAVTPNTGTPGSAVYPIGYVWTPPPTAAFALNTSSDGITSTATITWGSAGIHVVDVTANTGVGAVTEQYPIAVSARSVSITNFQTTTFGYSSNDGSSLRVFVPGQTLDSDIMLDYLPLPTSSVSGPTDQDFDGQGFDGQAFELHVIEDQQRKSDYVFGSAATVTITYNPELLSGGNKEMLTLQRWNGTVWEDAAASCGSSPAYAHEVAQNQFSVQICQAGQFALFGAPVSVFVPLVQ